jgi:hypothetical protein
MTTTLAQLTELTSIPVLDHLDTDVEIPVIDGPQAQGDLIVIPAEWVPEVTFRGTTTWRDVPTAGIELLRGGAGGNAHVLVADEAAGRWTTDLFDPTRLAIGRLEATRPVYLIHPEHGGTGIAPGAYVIRRQRQSAAASPDGALRPAAPVYVYD